MIGIRHSMTVWSLAAAFACALGPLACSRSGAYDLLGSCEDGLCPDASAAGASADGGTGVGATSAEGGSLGGTSAGGASAAGGAFTGGVSTGGAAGGAGAPVGGGGTIPFGGAGGASTGGGGGVSTAGTGAGGTGSFNCAVIGCGPPPLCSVGCQEPCGCCLCAEGDAQSLGGAEYTCSGGCWAALADGGPGGDAGTGVTSCTMDADCPTGQWCRATQTGSAACAPFQSEGESCGGFTPAWAVLRCDPSLVCTDVPPYLVDAPGTCRRPCASGADCGALQYCAAAGVCRDDGACLEPLDCDAAGNQYARPACKGYGECTAGVCAWQCGDPGCREVGSVDFGPCDAVLGFGVVGGQCVLISGCDAGGYTLWPTQLDCEGACVKPGRAP